MFKSVKPWMNIPFSYKPYLGISGTGSKQFANTISAKCYASGKVEIVTNNVGKEIISSKQLYVDGTLSLKELDNVLFENAEREVQAIGYFYDTNGKVDLKVVYL